MDKKEKKKLKKSKISLKKPPKINNALEHKNPQNYGIVERIYSDKDDEEDSENNNNKKPRRKKKNENKKKEKNPKSIDSNKRRKNLPSKNSHLSSFQSDVSSSLSFEDSADWKTKKASYSKNLRPSKSLIFYGDQDDELISLKDKINKLEEKSFRLEAMNGIFLDMIKQNQKRNSSNNNNSSNINGYSNQAALLNNQNQGYMVYPISQPRLGQSQSQPSIFQALPSPQPIEPPIGYNVDNFSYRCLNEARNDLKNFDNDLKYYFCK